jgi:hypothetical protein
MGVLGPWMGYYIVERLIAGDAGTGTIGYAHVSRGGRRYRIACCILSDGTLYTTRFWSTPQPDVMIATEVDAATWVAPGTTRELAMANGEPWATFPVRKVRRKRRTASYPRRQRTLVGERLRIADDLFRFPI